MKCEVQTKVWLTFDIDEAVIVEFNKQHDIPKHLLNNFNLAVSFGFNPFEHGCWEFSESSVSDVQENQTGKTWCELYK